MAKPIKHTPVLKGQDAINFYSNIASNKDKKVNPQELASIQKSTKLLQSVLKVK
jgi:hypothetical protein